MTHAPRRVALALLCSALSAALATTGLAAPPEPPLAELTIAGGPLRVRRDGALVAGERTIGSLTIDGAAPERASLRAGTSGGVALVEAGGWRRGRGHVIVLRAHDLGVLLDEPVGRTEDGELERHLQLAADGPRRWQSSPGVARCDAHEPLFLERWDARRGAWAREPLPVPPAPDLAPGAARALPPPQRALRFSSGSLDGHNDRADYLGAPRELDDGDPRTALVLGQGAAVRGAFVTAQAQRGVELVAVRVDPPAAPARLPTALVLVGGTPARPLHRLPLGARGGLYVLPQPVRGGCVSFVVDDAGAAPDVAIAEIVLYAADDAPQALPAHARVVAEDGPAAEDAARALEAAGAAGADAALAAIDGASAAGRRRLLRVVHALRGSLAPAHATKLVRLLETAHADERPLLVEALAAQPGGRVEAERLLADRSQAAEARVDAVGVLARLADKQPEAAASLVGAALDADAAVSRAARQAAEHLARTAPAIAEEALRRLAAGPAPPLLAILAAAAATMSADQRALASQAIAALGPVEALPFPLAVRALGALAALDAAAAARAIAAVLAHAEDATLRLVAVDAMIAGEATPTLRLALVGAARDRDARVRERALARLLPLDERAATFAAAVDDVWPQVRRVAYAALGARCAEDAAIAQRLSARVFDKKAADPDERSRGEALAALARCPGVGPERLAAAIGAAQPGEVRERAAQLLADRGDRALPLVAKALDKTFQQGGPEMPHVAAALLGAIGRIGAHHGERPYDDDTLTLLRDAAADPFYPGIRIAAIAALASGCPAGAHVVFTRADTDPEPAVQRAAAQARTLCPR